ncbi:MAG TPA: CPBP family intramembrane glutamic endopeptidase [Mycobacteriales bacterium]|jgi:membrane protease YdiL (CAAX protease family)|nr:CPBP family intramembrane glutamic endopeptidase [Mycobacteriales bacterium]
MHIVAAGVRLDGFGLVLGVVLGCYLVAGQPFVGAWNARRFRIRARTDPRARLDRYHRTIILEWALVVVALLVIVASGDISPGDLGLTTPGFTGGALPYTLVGFVGLALSTAGLAALRGRVPAAGRAVRGPSAVLDLMPRTTAERRTFAAVAVTAGICEELLYRGFGLAVLAALAPDVGPARTIGVAAVGFGLAHAYQGAAGIVVTAILGGCLAVLFLGTGSLLLPIAYHVLIDLRVLIVPVLPLRRSGEAVPDGA